MSKATRIRRLKRYLATSRAKSELEVMAIHRQLEDLSDGHRRGLVWNEAEARRGVSFFSMLRHWKGRWSGEPVKLEPFQEEMIVAPIFGWYREDGARRITEAYVELPRKNGKSTLAAGIALKMFAADGEPGSEVYSAATKHAQAMIVFNDAKQMTRQSPELAKRITTHKWSMHHKKSQGVFAPLASDESNLDGLNSYCNVIDELHQHKTRGGYDKLVTSHGSRDNPLDFVITTAGVGDDPHSIAMERPGYAAKVLSGVATDDSLWAFVTTADKEDDWTDPDVWAKANPNLGVSVSRRFLVDQCNRAQHSAAYENAFRRYYLNQWTEQAVRWLSVSKWDELEIEEPDLKGRPCYVGLDLADNEDLNAMALFFPGVQGGDDFLKLHCWCPEDTVARRMREGKFAYADWVRRGYLEKTSGSVTDHNAILERIYKLSQVYDVQQVAYDPFNALMLVNALDDSGFVVVKVLQQMQSLAPGTKEFERRVLQGTIKHDGNPLLRWMISNVCVDVNANKDMRPNRKKSSEKIDGVIAAIMALSRAMVSGDKSSVYESRGVIEV